MLGRKNDGQKEMKETTGEKKSEERKGDEKGGGGAVNGGKVPGREMNETTLKTARLTCLCLYSSRQATMWVDMIAEDLLAAVRHKWDKISNT